MHSPTAVLFQMLRRISFGCFTFLAVFCYTGSRCELPSSFQNFTQLSFPGFISQSDVEKPTFIFSPLSLLYYYLCMFLKLFPPFIPPTNSTLSVLLFPAPSEVVCPLFFFPPHSLFYLLRVCMEKVGRKSTSYALFLLGGLVLTS